MHNTYSNIICLHPKDKSTDFLKYLGEIFGSNYRIIEDNKESHKEILLLIESFTAKSLVVFLGHGHSHSLSSANTENFQSQIFIDALNANKLFKNHDVLLLACRSSEFIGKINLINSSLIGFGNILSSTDEVALEAEYETGIYRNLEQEDINFFNETYVDAISKTFILLFNNKIKFNQMPRFISYFLNKSINIILRETNKKNRVDVAKLLFEFRNEMILK